MTGIWPDNIFPSPYEVAEDLFYGGSDGSLFYGIVTSMWRLSIGLTIAIAGGIVLGIFMVKS
jgi:ABC-type nitrate/sulfonate/bicarbonate transport system, permease component